MSKEKEFGDLKLKYEKYAEINKEKVKKYGLLRLLVFVILISSVFLLKIYKINQILIAIVVSIIIYIFIYLIKIQDKYIEKEKLYRALVRVNEKSIDRITGEWKKEEDIGIEYIEKNNFSIDLDVFGKGSIFQKLNTTKSNIGREYLKNFLIGKSKEKNEIEKRQKAIHELSEKLEFRQKIEANLDKEYKVKNNNIENWIKDFEEFFTNKNTYIFFRIYSVLIWSISILLVFVYGYSISIFSLVFVVNFVVDIIITKGMEQKLNDIFKYRDKLRKLHKLSVIFGDEEFESEKCINLKRKVINEEINIIEILKKIDIIGNQISDRKNIFYIILKGTVLMDIINLFKIEVYKKKYGDKIVSFIYVIGEIEALNSLATVEYENENTVYPIFENENILKGEEILHPLIISDGVGNDFEISKEKSITLITGSNMAGKSTFLRTIGLNMILAYSGAKVFAKKFSLGVFDIYTVMRIEDNLQENISSFYGEIKKIKNIIDECNKRDERDRSIFLFIDEIFKGTNSFDRHEGARALILQLRKYNALGMISTHDLELCDIEQETDGKVRNMHFREYYSNGKLKFDYKLREGRSRTRNAKYLMDMAGIEILD